MGRLLSEPWVIGTIVVLAVLLFSAPKLPSMARSLGQSMRILRSEMRDAQPQVPNGTAVDADYNVVRTPSPSHPEFQPPKNP